MEYARAKGDVTNIPSADEQAASRGPRTDVRQVCAQTARARLALEKTIELVG